MSDAVLKVKSLKVYFPTKGGLFIKEQVAKVVDGVSFEIYPRKTFGFAGRSGCGKSTTGYAIVKLYEPTSGTVYYHGEDVTRIKGSHLTESRRNVQMIFQDPYANLNPHMTVGEIIHELMDIHHIFNTKEERKQRVRELLDIVELKPSHIRHYPHELSGGQCQRVGIARTLALNPQFVVCDEPINALDVSVQAQIINLLEHVQKEMGISCLFIAHDLSVVGHISDRIGATYLGDLVETGDNGDVYHRPLHPYTQVLLSAAPTPSPRVAGEKKCIALEGELPSPLDTPNGCILRTRCPSATECCTRGKPGMVNVGERTVTCFLYEK